MIILTGGAGFIGSAFLSKLNQEGIKKVLVVDHLGESPKWKNLVGKDYSAFVNKNTFSLNLSSGVYAPRDIECIIHMGACTVTTENDADYVIDNNLNYSMELAQFALLNNVRFIYASSAATYGNGEFGYSDDDYDEMRPLNVYGYSKHQFDKWVLANKLERFFTGLKFFNVFGPNEYHKGDMASMVYKSYNQIKETGKVRLFKSNHPDYKDGEQMRDFIYVKDVVDAMWKIYCDEDICGIYNLGTGKARTWNDLASSVFAALGKKSNIEYIEMPQNLSKQYQNFTQAEMEKLNSVIDIDFTSLEDSISDYVKNYLEKDWQYL
jgi:ADP-L-glycero-D-manno-heptose 6-epimerase